MMNKKMLFAALIVSAAALSFGQFGGGGGGRGGMSPGMLVTRKDVQKDLNLSTDQLNQIIKIQTDMRDAMRARMQGVDFQNMSDEDRQKMFADMQKANDATNDKYEAVLTKTQHSRVIGIFLQLNGNSAALNKEIQTILSVTTSQKAKIDDLRAKQQAAMGETMQKVRSGELQWSDMQGIMQKSRDVMNTEIGKILTATQKAKIVSLQGAKFTPVEEPNNGGRGGWGGGGGGGGWGGGRGGGG
jgi:hypothetical protein